MINNIPYIVIMALIDPNIQCDPKQYFLNPQCTAQRQYEALRVFFCEGLSATDAANKFSYTISAFYSLIRDFKGKLKEKGDGDLFFQTKKLGRKEIDTEGEITNFIVSLRKQYLSVPEIKSILDVKGYNVSEKYVSFTIKKEGFARLPRRDKKDKEESLSHVKDKIQAPISKMLEFAPEKFSSQNAGILCLIPFIIEYGLDNVIATCQYPETKVIDKFASILSFVALKVSGIRRYSADDLWCMDRGMGLFPGLNALPKSAWFTSYSHRVTRNMNSSFLKQLHEIWKERGLLSDTVNLDFTAIPYWGDDDHLENNWSGKRNKALSSILAILAQDPDSGIIDYGDTNVRHDNQGEVVLEFLDFYRGDNPEDSSLKYLVFDCRFTAYENLRKLDDRNIKFVTIRRRGKNIIQRIEQLPPSSFKKIHVMKADGKGRTLKVYEEETTIKGYNKPIRQVAITGHGRIKPALIITNDFDIALKVLVKKYSRCWLVEKGISEQIEFFHLNRVSSSMVIKVDFDLTMSIFVHNLYRLFAQNLPGYSHQTDLTIFEKFLYNGGEIEITEEVINVKLKKKRNMPALLTALEPLQKVTVPWLGNKKIHFSALATS